MRLRRAPWRSARGPPGTHPRRERVWGLSRLESVCREVCVRVSAVRAGSGGPALAPSLSITKVRVLVVE